MPDYPSSGILAGTILMGGPFDGLEVVWGRNEPDVVRLSLLQRGAQVGREHILEATCAPADGPGACRRPLAYVYQRTPTSGGRLAHFRGDEVR
jgi:hypothetical protein